MVTPHVTAVVYWKARIGAVARDDGLRERDAAMDPVLAKRKIGATVPSRTGTMDHSP